MAEILRGLNDAQRMAVSSPAAVLQVLAPPGSGKTKTLTARVAYLIDERSFRPWNIIVCTFTKKAASEMKDRITSFVGDELAKKLNLGTFHSVALKYLKWHGEHLGLPNDFGVADTTDSRAILKRIIKKFDFAFEPAQALARVSTRKVKGAVTTAVKTVEHHEFETLFAEYENALAAAKLLDYDDILLRCCDLLRLHPECVANVQAVLIDEFQDTNTTQYDLMSLFAQRHNNITIVGDPDQSIYGFCMAEIGNLARMKIHWPDTLTINLEENYRSSGAILHAAQKIIEQDHDRPPKKLQATHSYGLRPVLRKIPHAAAEAEWLVSEIKRATILTNKLLQHDDFAILLRSANLSRVIETALGNAGIPYRMVGNAKFYDRVEVKLILDYLRVIHNPSHNEALERIINIPPRRIGDESVKRLREEAQTKEISSWELIMQIAQGRASSVTKLTTTCRKGIETFVNVIITGQLKIAAWTPQNSPIVELINLIAQKINLQTYLKSKYAEEDGYEARWANVEELMAQAAEASSPQRVAEMIEAERLPNSDGTEGELNPQIDVLSTFLSNIALTASANSKADDEESVRQITISTIHAAKGLEWPVVFVPACFDGSIPHSRADDHDEERRLLYVAITRAQALLYLSCPLKSTQREEVSMCPYLTEPGVDQYFENHGPTINASVMDSLSTTLRRAVPSPLSDCKDAQRLASEEDNLWPLNGEDMMAEMYDGNDWNSRFAAHSTLSSSNRPLYSTSGGTDILDDQSVTRKAFSGFVSVAAKFDRIMEQNKEKSVLAEKRNAQALTAQPEVKSRKRTLPGQKDLSSFFVKRSCTSVSETGHDSEARGGTIMKQDSEIVIPPGRKADARVCASIHTHNTSVNEARHKPKSTVLFSRPKTSVKNMENTHDAYVFLSSSPTREETPVETENAIRSSPSKTLTRPAISYHTTSVDQARAVVKKTLGVRRSLNGWTAQRRYP